MTTPIPSPAARRFRRSATVEEAPLQGELMLFDPATSRFFVLNRTMTFVWRRCDGEHTVDRMLDELEAEFAGVEKTAAEADLQRALDELAALGLVVDGA